MRILFVTPYLPSRIRVRPYNFIKSLSASHEVSLVSLFCDEYEREMVQDVASYCASIDLVPLPRWRAYANCLQALPTLVPLRVAYYRSEAFIETARQVIRERAIDIVHGELIKVVPALQALLIQENVPILFDAVDCISWYLQQQQKSLRNPLKKTFVRSELQKMRRYERKSLRAFEQVVITSPYDRDRLVALDERLQRICVVPNGVDIDYFSPLPLPREKDSLVFCAKLDYYPNSQAILSFYRDIMPLVWKQRPQVRLTIVGSNPPESIRNLSNDERITVTGNVPDIRPYLGSASVALAPLRITAGIQNKVLEAMAMATPLVATPDSCRSLQVKDGIHLFIAEDPGAYAESILKLLGGLALAQDMGCAGRRYVEQNHSWARSTDVLNQLYNAILSARGKLLASAPTS